MTRATLKQSSSLALATARLALAGLRWARGLAAFIVMPRASLSRRELEERAFVLLGL